MGLTVFSSTRDVICTNAPFSQHNVKLTGFSVRARKQNATCDMQFKSTATCLFCRRHDYEYNKIQLKSHAKLQSMDSFRLRFHANAMFSIESCIERKLCERIHMCWATGYPGSRPIYRHIVLGNRLHWDL